jgi:hypothetical protein
MAAYHKVEVSLNTNAVEVGIPSPQTVNVTLPTIGPAGPTGGVGPAGPTGPQGVPGTGLEVLTTQGDLLYQGSSTGQRLAIGTSGQVLKVANGIPAWGNESGAVTSVNGETGAVSLSAADVGAAAASHTHDGTDVFLTDDEAYGPVLAQSFAEGRNGIYWPTDLTINSKPVYKLNRTYGMFFENLRWHIFENSAITANIVSSSADDQEDFPHQTTWSGGNVQRANVANFGTLASQQFQFVGDVQRVGTSSGLPLKTGSGGAVEAGAFGTGAGQFAEGSDPRFSDSRQPTLHGSTHHTGGTDALAAHQINGQTIFSVASVNYSADQTLPANRARQITISNSNAGGITVTLPTQAEGTLNGDTYVIVGGSTMSGPITVRGVANLSPLVYNTLVTITATGQQYRLRSGGGSGGSWGLIPVDTHTHTGAQVTVGTTANLPLKTGTNGVIEAGAFGTAAGQFAEGSHIHELASLSATGAEIDDILASDGDGAASWRTLSTFIGQNVGPADIDAANRGAITASGLTQATARILGRTSSSAGSIEEIQIGSGLSLSAGELSATGSGVTAVGASTADVLSVSGSDLVADDPNADRIVFWDDSAGKLTHLTVGSGLAITDTTLDATGGGGSSIMQSIAVGLVLN